MTIHESSDTTQRCECKGLAGTQRCCVYLRVFACICVYLCVFVCICMYLHVFACIDVRIYVYLTCDQICIASYFRVSPRIDVCFVVYTLVTAGKGAQAASISKGAQG